MANPDDAPSENPFDQFDPDKAGTASLAPTAKTESTNPFDQFGDVGSGPTSATGAFARGAARGALPAIGSIPAMGAGAELGGAIGLAGGPFAEITSPVGAFIGGGIGAIGGAAAVSKIQDYALKMLPDSWKDTLGLSDRQQKLDEGEHPIASFLGGIAPYALTMRPGAAPKVKLPENATALQRIMANPATARLFGGAAMGGMQLGQEAVSDEGEGINWNRVAISTGFGLVFNRPTRFGERITELGARPARALLGRPSPVESPTLNQAADAKVAGPGVTEPVFQGTHAQDPASEMTAQQAVRNEQAVMGTAPSPTPDLHATARRLDPELFARYDDLTSQRDVFQGWIAESGPEEAPVAGKHLAAIDVELRSLEPEVQAAYRRAAEMTGGPTTERPGTPERFPSLAAMLAARGEESEPVSPPAEVQEERPAVTGEPPPAVPMRTIQEQKDFIAQDVARQLTAAGRPQEEAQAAGVLTAARYSARAARFGGKLGTPEELYRREGADIRGGRPGPGAPPTPSVPAPPLAPADQARAQNIDTSKDVVSGANSSKDPNGPVYIDPRIPQYSATVKDAAGNPVNLWNSLQLHERVETDEMAKGATYDQAHKTATDAERELARRTGYDFDAYTHEMDGYLSSIEHEKAENPPTDTHIDPQEAIGHHRSTNKSRMTVSLPAVSAFERSGMIENAQAYKDAARRRREQNGGSTVKVYTSAAAQARANGTTVKEADAERTALEAEHGARFDEALKTSDIESGDVPKDVRQSAIQAMINLGMDPIDALDYAMLKAEHEAQWIENEDARLAAEGNIESEEGHGADVTEIPFDTGERIARLGEAGEGAGTEEIAAARGTARQVGEPQGAELYQRPTRGIDDHLLEGLPETAEFKEGKGQLGKGKFAVYIDDKIMSNYESSKEAAVQGTKQRLANESANAERKQADDARRSSIRQKLIGGDAATDADLKFLGLRSPSGMEWFIPAASKLFDIPSRAVRPFIRELVRIGYSDAGAAHEYVDPTKALAAIAERRSALPLAEPGAEGKPQLVIPGADRITQAELVQRRANAPLRPGVEQKPADEGLFGDQSKQEELFQRGSQLGSIVLNPTKAPGRDYIGVPDVRPIMRIAAKGDPSTFIHESGHQYLGELMRDAEHPQAPDDLKADAKTVLDWLKVDSAEAIETKQHEKFARGFEQYLREGVAPSPELASVFGKFRDWLLRIYQTLRGLGTEITPEIRGVFDRLLASEPQRTVIAPERMNPPTLADIHEADAAHTEPHEAEPAMDRVLKETDQFIANFPRSAQDEHAASTAAATAEPGAEASLRPSADGQVVEGGRGPQSQAAGGAPGAAGGAQLRGGGAAGGEGAGQPAGGERPGVPGPTDAGLGDKPLAPRPKPQFGAAESPFLDKAGNIRVENLTTREDVAQAIRDAANENQDFIGDRRGVVTDGQIEGLAEDIGMAGAEDLVKQRVLGQAFNAEQVMALRKLSVQSATDVSAAMKKAATGSDEDVIAYAMAKDRHQMIQATVAQATAEAGRALRAFRNIAGMTQEAQQADLFIREATGKTLFQLRREARLGAELKTPQQVSQFMLDSQNKNFGRMIMEYWINGLISGPVTHMTYGIGNEILTLQKAVPETIVAAALGNLRRSLGREGDTVRMGEVGQKLRAHGAAFAPAAKAFFDALRTGQTVQLPGERIAQNVLQFPGAGIVEPALYDESAKLSDVMASLFSVMRGVRDGMIAGGDIAEAGGHERPFIGLRPSLQGAIPDTYLFGIMTPLSGSFVRAPSRLVAAIHSFFRGINFSMEKAGDSFRTATNEGLTGTAFDERVAEMRARPSQAKMEQYGLASSETTLMGQGGAFTKAISALFNTPFFATKDASGKAIPGTGFPLLKFIDPFVHISSNIIQQSLVERTPLGVLSPTIRADLMGRNGSIAQDTAMARMLVGTAYAIGLGGLAAEGYVSGSEPADPRQAAVWRLAGNQAHSVRIGDVWYDVHRLGPLGMLLGISADLYDVSHLAEQGDILNAASHLQHAITQNILDESFMRGPSDLIRAVEDPGRYGESYIKNFLSGFVPYSVGMSQIARATDPYSRQARTVMDSIRAKVPGMSESLLPRRDIWGEALPNKDALAGAGVTAIYEQRVSRDPVNLALLNLGIYPAQLERKIRNVQLTDQQYDDFQRIAGRMTKQRLDAIVNAPDFRTWPNNVRHDVIAEVITQSREAARGLLMMKNPQIVRDAAQRKLDRVNGVKP